MNQKLQLSINLSIYKWAALKLAATALEYPILKGIPIERINTHSLQSGGANALALASYSDTQIQKMGRWRGATFKEYLTRCQS